MSMKGLLLKDYYCMKSNLFSFLCLTIGVIILGIMFAFSIQHGNLADVAKSLIEKEGMSEEDVFNLFRVAVWLILLIPMAYVGNVVDCFKADMSASFGKQLFSMPIKASHTVAARYLVCLLYAGISFVGSLIAALFIAGAAKQYPLSELLSLCATFGAILVAYLSIVMMLLYQCGTQHVDLIQGAPVIATLIAGIVYVVIKMENSVDEEALLANIWESIRGFFTQYTGVVCGIALVVLLVCFSASVKIVEKRRVKAIC